VPGSECEEVRKRNADYSKYVSLTLEFWNYCTGEFANLESGYCEIVNPPDVIQGFRPDGQPVYAGFTFLVCPPRGQPLAHPMKDVELIHEE
jgi:hypothetical protein